jgi:hypothetical protein
MRHTLPIICAASSGSNDHPILEAQAAPWQCLIDQLFDPKPDRLCTTQPSHLPLQL